MEALATKTTNPTLQPIPVTKGERLELQKKLYNYIIKKWNIKDKDYIQLNRAEISQAIEITMRASISETTLWAC